MYNMQQQAGPMPGSVPMLPNMGAASGMLQNFMVSDPKQYLERLMEQGDSLSRGKWSNYVESLQDKWLKKTTSIMLENTDCWLNSLTETTLQRQVGNFDKYAFPMIRAIFPNLIANEIVSVQPMPGPISLVFFLDFLFGTNKGQIQAGETAFDAVAGPRDTRFYSSDDIDQEPLVNVPAGPGSVGPFNMNLAYLPVQRGTVQIIAGNQVAFDNGAGGFQGDGVAGNIDYDTGVISGLTYAGVVAGSTLITGTYRYDSEANDVIPQVDLQLTSSPVVARHRKLRTRWSIEAQAALRSLHGLDAQSELASFTAHEIKFEIDREIINDLFTIALAGQVNWSISVPPGISFTEHKLSFIDAVIELGNLIFLATRRGQANFLVTSVDVANVIESLPTFVAEAGALSTQKSTGVIRTGTLNNRWGCYKDPFLGQNLPNKRIWFGGYKGSSFLDAGYVYAPYLPLYTTPTIYLDDFIGRKGLGTAYGKKAVNPRFYATGQIVA